MSNVTAPPFERPLTGPAKLGLILGAAGTIGLFYLFITLTILCLLLWVGLELAATILLMRFGLSRLIIKYLERDAKLIGLLARGLWLRRGAEFRLKLKPGDAPELMVILGRLCARLQIPLPNAVFLEMNASAWVELKGLRQNLGKTNIGIGYDLLAGLSVQQVEAVLAHELAHAKLINRFLKNWLNKGLGRAAMVANLLSANADSYRRGGNIYAIAEAILTVADSLTRWCARMVSAYSRQDEFEADRGAADLCGAAPIRSSLQRLDPLHATLARLPWNERVAQIQSTEGLSQWLVRELAAQAGGLPEIETPAVFNRYSTHPAMRDRLAALPEDGSKLDDSPPGISLLAQPDALALKLVDEIERQVAIAEQKDLQELRRWLSKFRRGSRAQIRPAQLPGAFLVVGGLIFGAASLIAVPWYGALVFTAVPVALGWFWLRVARYRDKLELPRPPFTVLKAAWSNPPVIKDITALQKTLEQEMEQKIAGESKPRRKAAVLAAEAYAALGRCDYFRAHVAARLGYDYNKKSVENALALAVASAALNQPDQSDRMITVVVKGSALRSASTVWGAAWATILMGAWLAAEAFLHEALKQQPDDATLLALLALSQSHRHKPQSAVASIRRTCKPQAASTEHLKLLIRLLLDKGDLREARTLLQQLDQATRDDREVQLCWIRLHLLQREFSEAARWIKEMEALDIPANLLITIGRLYMNARDDAKATAFFDRALARGHYPEARLALARQAAQGNDRERARAHILAALDITKPLGENALAPHQVFQNALWQLMSLEPATADCRAWIAGLPLGSKPGALNRRSMMVYARDEPEAEAHLQVIRQAMEPDKPALKSSYFEIKPAPKDLQPARPVKPGVQRIYN